MVISKTPYRVSFFGGGTDYPVWFRKKGGAVLSTTIDKYCYLTCRYLPPFFDHKLRVVWSKIENVKKTSEIEHPAVRGILRYMKIKKGIEIHHVGDLPARSGLGSSSSFTVGLLHALYALKGIGPTSMKLSQEAIHVEKNILKENVGCQDQVAVAYGGFNKITFCSDGRFKIQPVVISARRLRKLQEHLLLYFTGITRFSSEISKVQIEKTPERTKELSSMLDLVDKAKGILNGRGDLIKFGELLDQSWQLKRSLTDKISNPQIDEIYSTARRAGAIGGKLLGAGGGGFMIFFVRPEEQPRVKQHLKKLLNVPFQFEDSGSEIIFNKPDFEENHKWI